MLCLWAVLFQLGSEHTYKQALDWERFRLSQDERGGDDDDGYGHGEAQS